jgi:peptidoglycan/xylan/chitin deacetylase (PgdA/CDA1 family)
MRRRLPLLLLPLAAAAVVAVVLSGSGAGGGHASRTRPSTTSRHPQTPPARPRIVHGPHRDPVPILMYHVISAPQPGAPYPELYTPERVFAAQMRALARRGYRGVTLAQVDDYWRRGYALPRKPIVVSFDDGYLSHYTHARPVLHSLGWPGVLNLEVNNVRPGDLTTRQVKALIAAGWEIDSHTITHPDLRTLTDARLRHELVASRAFIRSRFGVPANYFCYPAGRFDARVVAAVKAAGYRLATTTQPGLAEPSARLTLNRIRVDGQDGVAGLISKLAHPQTAQNGNAGG